MDEIDRRLLAFAGAHRVVTRDLVIGFLKLERRNAAERVSRLEAEGLVRVERLLARRPGLIRVTARGLAAIGSRLPAPRLSLAELRHDLWVVWLWLLAWRRAFGEVERVLSQREMQALDGASRGGDPSTLFGLPLDLGDRGAADRLAYPDVMLVNGEIRVAVHLVTWPHRGHQLERRFECYRALPKTWFVLVFVDDREVGDRLIELAARAGLEDRVRVQTVRGEGTALPSGESTA